ncbi:hypothetical protein COU60_01030 [Candidatus Pacearchaeota archaeon CG10_big_fil_rev_8_21_14_0_10_34_76]|nr:MAG: hypothetical protein COU60_01030 [Candidatus Pacearchaeota archaeon CG10_big_fil_rev_8_21_14_0_10_34_76]
MKQYLVLAVKNLRKRGLRSWLTLLGICIGIAAVVSLISLGDALKDTVNSQFNIASVEVISVQAGGITGFGPPGSGVSKHLTKQDSDAIERLSSVEFAIPRNLKTVSVEYNDKVEFVMVSSVPNDDKIDDMYTLLDIGVSSGRLMERGEKNLIMIGDSLADGEKNSFERDIGVGNKLKLNGEEFRIVGVLEKKGSFIIDGTILINSEGLKEISDIGDNVDLIVVRAKDKDSIDDAKRDIEDLLRERRDVKIGEEDFEVSTPEAQLESINEILTGIQVFIVIIASISIFIGAVGIANTMTTSVIERRKEIGIMKAIGARNKNIFYQFFVEAGLLGLIGGLIGAALGIGIGYLGTTGLNIFLGTSTKPNINFILIISSLLGSFIVGSISGVVPAMNAAKQNPVEAIRG